MSPLVTGSARSNLIYNNISSNGLINVPSAVTDPYYSNVSLLLHMDGANESTTFTDNSSSPKTVTAYGNAQISTAQSKFGGASGLFDGNGDYLTVASTDALQFGSASLTWGMWIRTSTNIQYATLYSRRPGNSNNNAGGWALGLNWTSSTSGDVYLYLKDYAGAALVPLMVTSGVNVLDNIFHHIAVTKNASGVWNIWVDGVSRASATFSYGIYFYSTSDNVVCTNYIGKDNVNAGRDFAGNIDEFSVYKGVALYTATFTPPTAAFPDS